MDEPKTLVLVVDDEQGMRDMLGWSLSRSGFDIQAARDGEEAISILAGGAVDVMVTDLTMPNVNGFRLLEAVRDRAPRTGVIVVTGFGTVEAAVFAMRQGAADFLLKPFDPQLLAQRIKEVAAEARRRSGAGTPAQAVEAR